MKQKAKILIVEDNAIVAADIRARVQLQGYEVTGCVSRGEEVLDHVEREAPDLILMDIQLKEKMSGIEAAAMVRDKHDLPIVYLTSYTDLTTLNKAKQTEPYGYIVKPFDDKDLRTSIEISLNQHQLTTKLKKSEEWFKTTLSSIGDGVIATDMDSKVSFMNPVAEKLTGWSLKEVRGKKITEIFNIINEITGQTVDNPVDKVIETGRVVGLANNTLLVNRYGKKVPIKDSGAPIVIDEKNRVGVVLVFQDDSKSREADRKLRESEERFRRLFDYAPLPYQSLNAEGNFREVNRTWLNILGYDKEDVLGKNFGDFLHPDWQDHFQENFPKFKSIGEVLGVEFQMRRKDGTFITVQFDGKTSSDDAGNVIRTHCVFRDITKVKALESKIKEQEKLMIQNQKLEAIGTLAGGVAHDFNNILSSIIGFTELSLDSVVRGSGLHDDLNEVLTASYRARDLVKQILTFSRKGEEEKKVIDIKHLIYEAISMMRSTVPTTVEIIERCNETDLRVIANESQLHQVIVNLITNSVHSIEQRGSIEVGVEKITVDEEGSNELNDLPAGEYAKIIVRDDGCGIPVTIIDSVFDPYFTTKTKDRGTGLGLSVVHGIVRSHNGWIEISSQEGEGTAVSVWLPISQIAVVENFEPANVEQEAGTERILIVDDEVSIAKLHTRSLKKVGYDVVMATDSFEAFELFQTNPKEFDLVVTDMAMPSMTGKQLAESIKKVRNDVPIILCTGYSEGIEKEEDLPVYLDGLLLKPVNREDLVKKIRELLG